MVELVISIVLIGLAVSGTMLAMTNLIRGSGQPQRVLQAISIAESYMEEIRLQPVDDPQGGANVVEATRDLYDAILDYDGINQAPTDQLGSAIASLSDYTVRVSVVASGALGPAGNLLPSTDTYRIDVRVTHPDGTDITLSSHRARF